jgi:hypothetical protein
VEEEKEEVKSRDLDLPDMEEFHESVEERPQQQPPANFVVAFWQLFMTVFFAHFLQNNPKKLANEPANATTAAATTTTPSATSKKES